MVERYQIDKTVYKAAPGPHPLFLTAQDASGSQRYWSTEEDAGSSQEALEVANKRLSDSLRVSPPSLRYSGSEPPRVWIVPVDPPEGSDIDDLVQFLDKSFKAWEP